MNITQNIAIEVFETNVSDMNEAERLRIALLQHYPGCCINFDLEDRDNILRMEGPGIDPKEVERLSKIQGFSVSELRDQVNGN